MSADEIRRLAESVLRHRADVIPCLSDDTHTALLAYAAMVERCEERHADPYGISDDDYNYILKGETDGTKH